MAKSVFTKNHLFRYFIILIFIVVISIGASIGCYLYYGHEFEARSLNAQKDFENKLNLGSSFSLDEILESQQYSYAWINRPDTKVDIYAVDEQDAYEKTDNVLSYSIENRIFQVIGIAKGKIVFTDAMDSTVSVEFPFETHFSKNDTSKIVKYNYNNFYDDGIVDLDEIKQVKEITIPTSENYNVSEFALFPNLTRIIISATNDLAVLQGLNEINNKILFYVTDGLYDQYMDSDEWHAYNNRIFPIVNLEEGNCTIVFEFNGGKMSNTSADVTHYFTSVHEGETISLNDYQLTKTGHTFEGWYVSKDNGVTLTTKIDDNYIFNENTKLYAKWNINQYDIVYHDKYTIPPETQHVLYNETIHISSMILEHTGYSFLGWTRYENEITVEFFPGQSVSNLSIINGDVVDLYSIWTTNSYSIVYNANNGYNAPSNLDNVAFDEEVTLSNDEPTRMGYTFLGWSTNSRATEPDYRPGDKVKNLVSDDDGKVTLYAVWAPNTYTIKYDANGGIHAPEDQSNLAYGSSIKLRSTVPTWEGRVFKGWARDPYASYASYAPGDTVTNLVADADGVVTLYAVWNLVTFRIEYNANEGANPPSTSSYLTYNTPFNGITTSQPTRSGFTFKGWSTSPTGNVEFTSGQILTPEDVNGLYNGSDISTLYAVWSVNQYQITIDKTNAEVKIDVGIGFKNEKGYNFGAIINVTTTFAESDNRICTVKKVKDGTEIVKYEEKWNGNKYYFYFVMPAEDVKINASSNSSCIASGSLITLADGSTTKVENLHQGDAVLVFNHETGDFDISFISYIENDGYDYYNTLTLYFEDNVSVKVITEHGFFDNTLNKYVMINEYNVKDYIGHSFFNTTYNGRCYENKKLKLLSYKYEEEYLNTYSFVTAIHYNHFVNGFLGMATGIDGLYNFFDYDENMKYDEISKKRDIELYGLATYEEWSDYLSYEEFVMFNGQYVNVSIGKGMVTREQLIEYILKFIHPELKEKR